MEIDDDISSWEEASSTYLEKYSTENNKKRKTVKKSNIKKLHQILYILDCLKNTKKYIKSDCTNIYDKYNQIIHENGKIKYTNLFSNIFQGYKINDEDYEKNVLKKEYNEDNKKNILKREYNEDDKKNVLKKNVNIFLNLIMNDINARIYFVLNKRIESFIEYKLAKNVVEHNKLYDGNIFSVDKNIEFKDQTIAFSKKTTHHKYFLSIIEILRKLYSENFKENEFSKLDKQRIEKIPSNKNILQIHPLYATESSCRKNEFIYPKHPVLGKLNDEKVFKREMCNILKTERGWYINGRTLKLENKNNIFNPPKPYRILNGKKMYAEFQTIKIEIMGLNNKYMDYFHENHIPLDCKYLLCNRDFCENLKVKFAECVIGFRCKEIIVKGVFVYEKDFEFIKTMYDDYQYYQKISNFNMKFKRTIKDWKFLIKKMKRYCKIRKYVGL